MPTAKKEPEMLAFKNGDAWLQWLAKNYAREEGIWLKFFKKNSGVETIVYDEALDGALCYGWIDGQVKSLDDKAYVQKFTPRRAKSMWSKRNRDKVALLIKAKMMRQPGLQAIAEAQKDGRWAAAYDGPKAMTIPQDFMTALAKDPKAQAFFKTLNKANVYAIGWRLQTAKTPQTRQKRFDALLAMLSRGQKLY